MDVLSNDLGNENLRVFVAVPSGSTLQGSVETTPNQKGILYTTAYYGSPYVDTFPYSIQDATGQTAWATVKVAVGEWPTNLTMRRTPEGSFNKSRLSCLMLRICTSPWHVVLLH